MVWHAYNNKWRVTIRIFQTKNFARWAKKESITNEILIKSVFEIQDGLIDANLGGGLIKKRLQKNTRGKSGGYRTLVAFKNKDRSIFIFGFSKNERDNLDSSELALYKSLSKLYLNVSTKMLEVMCQNKQMYEVTS